MIHTGNQLQSVLIIDELPVLDPLSDHGGEDPTEIVMPCIRKEAAGVGEHSQEFAQIAYLVF